MLMGWHEDGFEAERVQLEGVDDRFNKGCCTLLGDEAELKEQEERQRLCRRRPATTRPSRAWRPC
eukprot:12119623-Alexandrium_andersonii.AAC.1